MELIVEAIPRMGLSERDQARRFITFVDGESGGQPLGWSPLVALLKKLADRVACYENKVRR
jgi:hypothetical protein